MADLKRQFRSVNIDSPSRVRPRLSEIGLSPVQLERVLDLFSQQRHLCIQFLVDVLSFTPDSSSDIHEHTVQDIATHIDSIFAVIPQSLSPCSCCPSLGACNSLNRVQAGSPFVDCE